MGKFTFISTELEGLWIIEPKLFGDERGYFMETFNDEFAPYLRHLDGTPCGFVQDNESRSVRGVLRGMHLQLTRPQGKLVRVIEGEVYDVAVDVRPGSPTYGRSLGVYLSEENKRQLLVPEGFLHGFLVTSPVARFVYKCTRLYAPEDEFGVMWNDPELAIDWPMDAKELILAAKDQANHSFRELTERLKAGSAAKREKKE